MGVEHNVFGRWGYSPEGSIRLRAKLVAGLVALLGVGGAVSVAYDPGYQPAPAGAVSTESGGLTWLAYSPAKVAELREQARLGDRFGPVDSLPLADFVQRLWSGNLL